MCIVGLRAKLARATAALLRQRRRYGRRTLMRSELEILKQSRNIAVVGATSTPRRPGNVAPKFLIDHGFNVIPVNPSETEVHGRKAYGSLSDIPEQVDIVSVFRRSEAVPPIVDEAIKIGAKVVWMQEGVQHEEAAAKATAAGLEVIMDRCIHCAVQDNESEIPRVAREGE
jgi:predicted CoA-binding protein